MKALIFYIIFSACCIAVVAVSKNKEPNLDYYINYEAGKIYLVNSFNDTLINTCLTDELIEGSEIEKAIIKDNL